MLCTLWLEHTKHSTNTSCYCFGWHYSQNQDLGTKLTMKKKSYSKHPSRRFGCSATRTVAVQKQCTKLVPETSLPLKDGPGTATLLSAIKPQEPRLLHKLVQDLAKDFSEQKHMVHLLTCLPPHPPDSSSSLEALTTTSKRSWKSKEWWSEIEDTRKRILDTRKWLLEVHES